MELKREQIIKALECCIVNSNCNGCPFWEGYVTHKNCLQTACKNALSLIKELTEERDGLENLIHTMSEIENRMSETIEELTSENKLLNVELGNANSEILRLIEERKELTEENERLRGCVKSKEEVEAIMRATYEPLVKEITKEQIDKDVADTVREYREQLHRAFAHSDSKNKFNKGDFLEMVDIIAEEMIGGSNAQK